MVDWNRGGCTGSLNRLVRREVREHFRENPVAQRARYPVHLRLLRRFFGRSFAQFLVLYLAFNFAVLVGELALARFTPNVLPGWTAAGPPGADLKAFVTNVAGYLISAQVGVLGVISIAIGLVTLIAQREGSSTDVQLYYHESLAFGVVASCVALLLVLCVQLVWPLQFIMHRLGEGTTLQAFKLMLLIVHISWLALNLAALAHFVATTFRFVQQTAREEIRERYITNFVLPTEMRTRLRQQFYGSAGTDVLPTSEEELESGRPATHFGFDFGELEHVELERTFAKPTVLHDVRMTWALWAIRRWAKRCQATANSGPAKQSGFLNQGPLLSFPIYLDRPIRGKIAWCRRRGGLPMSRLERFIVRRAFRFRRASHEA
jgi:hypothetical protein